jgi:hypothetical protein
MGPIASSVSPVGRLDRDDIARLSYNQFPIFGEVCRDKIWEYPRSTEAMYSTLWASLLFVGGLEAGLPF